MTRRARNGRGFSRVGGLELKVPEWAAVLAKDIFQDVASIYVEKDEKNEVSVQVIGDE
jgi:hypothetical protein